MTPEGPRSWRAEPVHRRLRLRQLVMAVLGLVVLALAAVDLAHGVIGPLGALAGFVGGALVGLLAARVNRVAWDDRTARVVSRVDRLGFAILVVTLIARLSRGWLLGHWAAGALLTALGLCVTAGGLVGRVLGTRRAVVVALRGRPRGPST
jgi:hypothetical protein